MTPRPQPRRFSEADVAEVRERTDLRELVSAHVDLRPAGNGVFKGLCPFHDEKTPSFTVTPARGTYHCFGCDEHGDAITWVTTIDHLTFPEAVRSLADAAGITLTETGVSDEDQQRASATRRALDVIAATDAYYRAMLDTPEATHAATELARRGFTRADATDAGCGWAPPGPGLLAHLTAAGFTAQDGIDAGVLRESTRGGDPYPFLRDRLTWPVHNATGAVVGWGGRRLSEDQQGKYVNSAASPWFDKSSLLYGWVTARKAAAAAGRIVLVEGYTDVMAFRRAGIEECVAACGTAIGPGHLRMIERALPEGTRVVVCLDPDDAGQKATLRTWRAATALLHRTEGVTLDGGDPCEVWQTHGPDALRTALEQARPLTGIVMDRVISAGDTTSPDGRSRVAREVKDLLAEVSDPVLRSGYVDVAASLIGVPAHVLSDNGPAPAPATVAETVPLDAPPAVHAHARDIDLQCRVVARVCQSPQGVARWMERVTADLFTDEGCLEVIAAATSAAADINPADLTPTQWAGRLSDHGSEFARNVISIILNGNRYNGPESDWELLVSGTASLRLARALDAKDSAAAVSRAATTPDEIDLSWVHLAEATDAVREAERARRNLPPEPAPGA